MANKNMCCAPRSLKHKPILIAPHKYFNANNWAIKTEHNFSHLLELAASDDIKGFKYLIERDISIIDDVAIWYDRKKGTRSMALDERTPLMVASSYGSINIVKFLVSSSVDVNRSCGANQITALHCAASGGSTNAIEVVKILLKSGANINFVDSSGKRAFDMISVSPNCLKMKSSLQLLLATFNTYTPENKSHELKFSQTSCKPFEDFGNNNEEPNLSWVNSFLKENSQEMKIRYPWVESNVIAKNLELLNYEGSFSYTHINTVDPITSWQWLSKHNDFRGGN